MDKLITFEVDGSELFADFENRKYFIKFRNYENEEITSEISEAIFYTYLTSKKKYKSNENEEYRHWEQIPLSDNEIYHKAFLKEKKVDEIIERKEMYDEIHKAIELLSKNQKDKIIEYYFKEKNMVEISKENNISKQAVSKNLKDSYEILRKILKNFKN